MSSARVFEKRTFGDLLADIQGKVREQNNVQQGVYEKILKDKNLGQ